MNNTHSNRTDKQTRDDSHFILFLHRDYKHEAKYERGLRTDMKKNIYNTKNTHKSISLNQLK